MTKKSEFLGYFAAEAWNHAVIRSLAEGRENAINVARLSSRRKES